MDKKEGGTVMAAIAFWQNSGSRNGGFTWRANKTGILGRRSMSGRQLYFSSFKGQRGIVDNPVENLFAGRNGVLLYEFDMFLENCHLGSEMHRNNL